MRQHRHCPYPGCDVELNRGFLLCRNHWKGLDPIARAKALQLFLIDRDRHAAEVFLQDEFARMKGEPS